MALRRLFIDISQPPASALVVSDTNRSPITPLHFTQGDTETIQLCILEPNSTGGLSSPYAKLNLAGYNIRLAIGTPGGTPVALVTSWSVGTPYTSATASLALTSVGLTSLLGSSNEVGAYFQVRLDSGSGTYETKSLARCTLHKSIDDSISTEPDPVEDYYTKNEANARFARRTGEAGEGIILTSPDGASQIVLSVYNDGTFHADPYT